MDANGSQLCGFLIEQLRLAFLASIGFKDHQGNAMRRRVSDYGFDRRSRPWLEQSGIADPLQGMKSCILRDHINKEIAHTDPP